LISSIVLIVPGTEAATFSQPFSVSRHEAGSPAHAAFPWTPAVTIAVAVTHISGLSSEEAASLQVATQSVPVSGLLLCGFLVGALGVLNDVTVTQASAVWTMAETDPDAGPRQLFALGMRIGRDHIASAVYTLVLAYAGSALPIMLLFTLSQQPLGTVLTSDQVAVESSRIKTP